MKLTGIAGASAALGGGLAGCSNSNSASQTVADTVVYGKIYTSNGNRDYAEAFAVKDGKYVYVGSEDGVKSFVKDGTTKIVDHRDKGLVFAGATEGHGHYVGQGMMTYLNLIVEGKTEDEIVANIKAYVEKNPGKEVYYSYGWDNIAMMNVKAKIDMRTKLDEICPDKPLVAVDNSGHNAFANSKAFELAGVTKDTKVEGGTFQLTESGELSGLVTDLAYNYVLKKGLIQKTLFTESDYDGICSFMEESLHSNGYTNYQDGWLNYWGNGLIEALSSYDKKSGLNAVVGGAYKIDSFDDWSTELDKAKDCMEKYPTDHFKCRVIKLFADGEAVESKTGWMLEGYADGSHGTRVWDTETMNSIVKGANEKGLSVHVHAQGDGATEQAVNAYVNGGMCKKDGIFNGICHGRNYTEETKKKMGENNIYAAENINWRTLISKENAAKVPELLDEKLAKAGYPIKSLIDDGILVTSSTDVPAASGAPTSVCGIIEVAVNDTRPDVDVWPLDEKELVSVEQALDIMTINGAKELMVADTRGSIEEGKYADFVLLDKDITTCEKTKINEGKVQSVYFEGRQVYSA